MKKFLLTLALLLNAIPSYGQTMTNRPAGVPINYLFTSRTATTLAPTPIVGGAVTCVKLIPGTPTSTAGVTFTANLNSVSASNYLKVDLSADTSFYSSGSDIACYFSAGTVSGTSVVPEVIIQFTITGLAPVQYGIAFPNYPVWMQATNGVPVRPGTVATCRIAKDAGAFTGTANSPVEQTGGLNGGGDGAFLINLTALEVTAKAVKLLCTAPGAQAYRVNITPQQ